MPTERKVTCYSPADRERLIDFFSGKPVENDQGVREQAAAYVDWMYHAPRSGIEKGPLLLLRRGEIIDGMAGALRLRLAAGGNIGTVNVLRDFRISRRGKGQGISLAREVRKFHDPTCGLANEAALEIWRHVMRNTDFFEISPFEVMTLKTAGAGPVSMFWNSGAKLATGSSGSGGAISIDAVESACKDIDGGEIDAVAATYPVSIFSSPVILQWRYREQPGEPYSIFRISEGKTFRGYLVMHTYDDARGRAASVDDMLVPAGKLRLFMTVIDFARSFARKNDANRLHMALTPYTRYRRLMRLGGFRPDSQFQPAPEFVNNGLPQGASASLFSNRDGWFYTLALA